MRRILITTGDPDGIGFEVTAKALNEIGPKSGYQFVIFSSARSDNSKMRRLLRRRFKIREFASLSEALLSAPNRSHVLLEIVSREPAPQWVVTAALACRENLCHALVTGPLSKTLIRKTGIKAIGHTEILSQVTKADSVFMTFLGRQFRVLLMTGHLPLKNVAKKISPRLIRSALAAAESLRGMLPAKESRRPIAVLGLNPHAGESGLLGTEEKILLRELRGRRHVRGPLVPDVAFLPENRSRFSVFVALYHDQGLIPFKMAHGFDGGAHLTAGLPIIRTSVDHGTAKDIYGKGKAKYGSMKDAILWAIKLDRHKRGVRK